MQEIPIHFLPIFLSALVRFAIGALWYSPALFLNSWLRLVGQTRGLVRAGEMAKGMAIDFVGNLVLAFVLLHAVVYAGAHLALQGAAVGFFNWLGFMAAPGLALVVYEKRPWKLYAINNGFHFV